MMQTTRRAVRPDGQYYRQSRRRRMMRSLSHRGNSRGGRLALLVLAVWLLGYWAVRHGFNTRMVEAVEIGVPIALIVIGKVLEIKKQ